MSVKQWLSIVAGVALLSAAGAYWFATHRLAGEQAVTGAERKVLYWYDPMVPNQHFGQPGKSPFMDMELVPKYADEADGQAEPPAGVSIDPAIVQNLGVRLATVERGRVAQSIEAAGSIGFNQRDVAVVQTRSNGFVARVYQRAPGDLIEKNQPLADLLIPEWAGAQAEFLALLNSDDQALIEAARQRLVLLGMPEDLIAGIEETRQQHTTVTARAPIAGVIESLEVRAGMSLSAGATLAKINGLDSVWLEAAIPEAQSSAVRVGDAVTAVLAAFPGESLSGRAIAVLPEANAVTRTVRVRVELPNAERRLKPGMFARVRLETGEAQASLFVPTEAVIRGGLRDRVIVVEDDRFAPVEVQIGAEADGKTVILAGLSEGQKVVASGQFLIDSEASLQGVLTRLGSTP